MYIHSYTFIYIMYDTVKYNIKENDTFDIIFVNNDNFYNLTEVDK